MIINRNHSVVKTIAIFIITASGVALFPQVCKAAGSPGFFQHARDKYGNQGAKAAQFLTDNMPEADKSSLPSSMLEESLDLAFASKNGFPWGKDIPEDIFLNDVLPYACLDEARDPWRKQLKDICEPLIKNCKTASEAAQVLNKELFNRVNVHYNTERNKPNQSPHESMAQGKASCTGLSILLVDACRSVGIPARIAGVEEWTTKAGNHTWVEVWDHGWYFMGADEYDPKGLNHAWFIDDASKAVAGDHAHAVYASSWKKTGDSFPLAWDRSNAVVPAEDVTQRYNALHAVLETQKIYIRLWDKNGGKRLSLSVELRDNANTLIAQGITKSGRSDLNDMLSFSIAPASKYWLRIKTKHDLREIALPQQSTSTIDIYLEETHKISKNQLAIEDCIAKSAGIDPVAKLKLDRYEAQRAADLIWSALCKKIVAERSVEMQKHSFERNGLTLQWKEKVYGDAPANGHSLWISMHGGGEAPKEVNDQQWDNQIELYKPSEGIYIAPRAPTDTWNMWHQDHIDPMFDRLIADYVILRGVDPNRVYIMGYSAGGDGVYMIGPRMADRWAAASMMAGHPNDASPLSLRNIPFYIFVGGDDSGYNRNVVAAEWGHKLDELQKADPAGYIHKTTLFKGLGHWMDRKDAIAIDWMAGSVRQFWPHTVVWKQLHVPGTRFYWLEIAKDDAKKGQYVHAVADGQIIRVETADINRISLRLSDKLLDLDKPVTVYINNKKAYQGPVNRTLQAIESSLEERADFDTIAYAVITLDCK